MTLWCWWFHMQIGCTQNFPVGWLKTPVMFLFTQVTSEDIWIGRWYEVNPIHFPLGFLDRCSLNQGTNQYSKTGHTFAKLGRSCRFQLDPEMKPLGEGHRPTTSRLLGTILLSGSTIFFPQKGQDESHVFFRVGKTRISMNIVGYCS